MSSRLFQEIRERRGLAYAVYSFISSFSDAGMFGAYAAAGPENAIPVIGLMIEAMSTLKKKPLTPSELQEAKEFTKGNLLLASESTDNQMVRLAQNELCFGAYIPLQEVLEKINATSVQEILDLANHLFPDGQMALTLLGPNDDSKAITELLSR